MACSSVTYLVHTFHNGVERSIVTDSGVSTVKVIVNCAGKTYDREVELLGKYAGTGQ